MMKKQTKLTLAKLPSAQEAENLSMVLDVWRRSGGIIANAIPEGRDGQRYSDESNRKSAQKPCSMCN